MNLLKSSTYTSLLKNISLDNKDMLNTLDGKTVMITGASGMIGSCIADLLMYANIESEYQTV